MRPNGVLSTSHLWPHTAWPSYTILIAKSDRCHILIIIVITTSDGNSLESDQKKSRKDLRHENTSTIQLQKLEIICKSHYTLLLLYECTKSHK